VYRRGRNGALGSTFLFPNADPFSRNALAGKALYMIAGDPNTGAPRVAKLDEGNNLAWNPSYLEFAPDRALLALAVPGATRLDIASSFYNLGGQYVELVIDRFESSPAPTTAASGDGLASVTSSEPGTAVTVVPAAAQAGTLAIASGQGLSLAGALYEVTPSPLTLSRPAAISIDFDPAGVDLASVLIYRFNGSLWESSPISGQTISDIASAGDSSGTPA
jgi:hypothetical protein